MKKLIEKLKPQKRVKVDNQWEGPNPEGRHTYVEGPIRGRDAK